MLCLQWLDTYYPERWSDQITRQWYDEKMDSYHTTIRITIQHDGYVTTYESTGTAECEYKKSDNSFVPLTYYKNSESDAFKRACVKVGAYNDVYSEDETAYKAADIPEKDIEWMIRNVDFNKFTVSQFWTQLNNVATGRIDLEKLKKSWKK